MQKERGVGCCLGLAEECYSELAEDSCFRIVRSASLRVVRRVLLMNGRNILFMFGRRERAGLVLVLYIAGCVLCILGWQKGFFSSLCERVARTKELLYYIEGP